MYRSCTYKCSYSTEIKYIRWEYKEPDAIKFQCNKLRIVENASDDGLQRVECNEEVCRAAGIDVGDGTEIY